VVGDPGELCRCGSFANGHIARYGRTKEGDLFRQRNEKPPVGRSIVWPAKDRWENMVMSLEPPRPRTWKATSQEYRNELSNIQAIQKGATVRDIPHMEPPVEQTLLYRERTDAHIGYLKEGKAHSARRLLLRGIASVSPLRIALGAKPCMYIQLQLQQ